MKSTEALYKHAAEFLPWRLEGAVRNAEAHAHWLASGEGFSYAQEVEGGVRYVFVDAAKREKRAAFDHAALASLLAKALEREVDEASLPVQHVSLADASGRHVRVHLSGRILTCDLAAMTFSESQALRPEPGVSASPDGKWRIMRRDGNLYVSETGGVERALTADGTPHYAYAKSPDFNTYTVVLDMFGTAQPVIGVWSPDSRFFFTHQLDERKLDDNHLLQTVPFDGAIRSKLYSYRFPFAGDGKHALWSPVIIDVETGALTRASVQAVPINDHTPPEWLRVWWSKKGDKVWFVTMSPDKTLVELHELDVRSGKARTLLAQQGETYQSLTAGTPRIGNEGRPNVRMLETLGKFVWYDDRGKNGQLFLCDLESGERLNAITPEGMLVRDILRVNENSERLWFTASGDCPGQDPYYRHFYRVNLDGSGLTLLTPGDYEHNVFTPPAQPGAEAAIAEAAGLSPCGRYLVDTMGRIDEAPKSVLRDGETGEILMTIEEADVSGLLSRGWRWPEVFTAKAADGETPLYGAIWRPSWADGSEKLPVILYVYPGPQITIVPKTSFKRNAREHLNILFTQVLAELGFVVVQVDPRGTALRERDFRMKSYGNLGGTHQHEDYIAVLRQLAEKSPDFDLERVGIHGHSGGGFSTARAMLTFPDFFKVGVASAGNHDLRGVLAMWSEAFHGPAERFSWERLDSAKFAAGLKGKLMIAFSDMDENVHPGLSMRLIDAFIKADKDVDILVIPNALHDFAATNRYFIARTHNYFVEHLAGRTPPAHYRLPD